MKGGRNVRVRSIIIIAIAVTLLGSFLLSGQALASSYVRYVFSSPKGGTVYLFTTPGSPGLSLLLRSIFGIPVPELLPEPAPRPVPIPPIPVPGPRPAPVPEPAPAPRPEPRPEPTPEPAPEPAPVPEPTPEPRPGEGEQQETAGLTAEEKLMIDLVNKERAKLGLKALSVDMRLTQLARKKSQDMIDKNYFSHDSPTYGSPFDMMAAAGITYRTAGENLAGASTVERAHEALMQSEGHRRNILNPAFTHIGVGAIKGGPYGMMFTQMFIGE